MDGQNQRNVNQHVFNAEGLFFNQKHPNKNKIKTYQSQLSQLLFKSCLELVLKKNKKLMYCNIDAVLNQIRTLVYSTWSRRSLVLVKSHLLRDDSLQNGVTEKRRRNSPDDISCSACHTFFVLGMSMEFCHAIIMYESVSLLNS